MLFSKARALSLSLMTLVIMTVPAVGAPADAGANEGLEAEAATSEDAPDAGSPVDGGSASPLITFASGPNASELRRYITTALARSPRLSSARAGHDRALALASRSGGLPDPVVSYGHYFEEVETRVGPQKQRYGLRQHIPLFGKLSLRREAARARADAAGERVRATELAVVAGVTQAYAECAYLARAREITSERLSLLVGLERVVRSLYAAGEASYSDLMSAQIGVARLESELEGLADAQMAASARLSAAVGDAPDGSLAAPSSIPETVVPETMEEASGALASNPELAALDLETEAARLERGLAVRAYFPDLTVGFDYIVTDEAAMDVDSSGKDPFIGVASVNVPLWFGQNSSRVREAEAGLNVAARAREDRANMLAATLETVRSRIRDLRRKEVLYEERLIPAAGQSVAAAEASYRAGDADFDALVRAHETALEFELSYARTRADLLTAAAELSRLTGSGPALPE